MELCRQSWHPLSGAARLLGAGDVRKLAAQCGIRPTKQRGQNFVTDANTVRKIVAAADVKPEDHVVEIGPGLGSLTLGLLASGAHVTAIEIDEVLAAQLPATVTEFAGEASERFDLVTADAMDVTALEAVPTKLVANLPYNVSVPVLLHFLETFESLESVLVMVQAEVAHRLAAGPGSRTYGVPSAKAAWWTEVSLAGSIGRTVFWPVPNVDSALVRLVRRKPPNADRRRTFAVIDAAFAQRRKTMRSALKNLMGSAETAENVLRTAGVDPQIRGEQLSIEQFADIARALPDGVRLSR